MGAFVNSTVTTAGILASAKALTGEELVFTKIVMGDGFLSEGQDVSAIDGVISPKVNVDIIRKKVESANTAVLGGVFTNKELPEGFYWRELGLYAQDPGGEEILYCYGNAGEFAEYIPAEGGNTIIEKNIDILTYVGNAANIKIYIAPDSYPTIADFEELRDLVNGGISVANEARQYAMEALSTSQQALAKIVEYGKSINENVSKVQTVWDALFANVVKNPWRLDFKDLDPITLTSGVWDKTQAILEC